MSFRKRNITLNWLLIFLHTFDICLEKLSLLSISVPKISNVSFTGKEKPYSVSPRIRHWCLLSLIITSHKVTYCCVTATPHEKKNPSHCLCTCSCGSLIVELALEFASIVSEALVVNTLRTAAANNNFGEFAVNASSIQGIAVNESPSTPPTGKTTGRSSDGMV